MRTPKTTKEDARKALLHLGTGYVVIFRYKQGYFEAVEAHTHPLQNASVLHFCGTHARLALTLRDFLYFSGGWQPVFCGGQT